MCRCENSSSERWARKNAPDDGLERPRTHNPHHLAIIPGTRLGVYEITAQIGEGGMGAVYRATDTSLSRQVAVKVLPDAFAADPDRLARFEREAKTLASLNHPHIAAIYGFERSGGLHAKQGDRLKQVRVYSPAAIGRCRAGFGGSDTTRSADAASFFLKSSTIRVASNPKATACARRTARRSWMMSSGTSSLARSFGSTMVSPPITLRVCK